MVEISINGNSEVVDLKIDDSLLEDKDSLQILLISCMNDIIKQSEENKKKNGYEFDGKFRWIREFRSKIDERTFRKI